MFKWLKRFGSVPVTNEKPDGSAPGPVPERGLFSPKAMERGLAEMLGIARGLLTDGIVTEDEARCLQDWAARHPETAAKWPGSVLHARLQHCFADGQIDEAERQDLAALLRALVRGTESVAVDLRWDAAATLPLDDPAPPLTWRDQSFVFTGRFAFGTRATCEREVVIRGGICARNVTGRTSFVVIGTFVSPEGEHSSDESTIRTAVELRDAGCVLRIVSEEHWARSLGDRS